jgi:hypothetical protein
MVKIPQVYKEEAMAFATNEAKKRKGSVGDAKWKEDFHDYLADALPSITMGRNPATKTLKEQGKGIFTGEIQRRFVKFNPDPELRKKAETRFKQLFGDMVEWYFEHLIDKDQYFKINASSSADMPKAIRNMFMRYYMGALLRAFMQKLYSVDAGKLAASTSNVPDLAKQTSFAKAGKFVAPFMNEVESEFLKQTSRIDLHPNFESTQMEFTEIKSNPKKKR